MGGGGGQVGEVRCGYSQNSACGLYKPMASLPTTSYSFAWASFLLFLYGSYFDLKCNYRQNDVPRYKAQD